MIRHKIAVISSPPSILPPAVGLFQVCSAVHNQDFTLVDDYITGLKTLLYLQGVAELAGWEGQSPPTPKHQRGKVITPKMSEIIGKVRGVVICLRHS